MDHDVSCNCEDCWWSRGCTEVDEWGVEVEDSENNELND